MVDITLPTIYLSNEPTQLPQQIPIECDYDEHEEALTSRSISQPDEIHSQIEEQEKESQQDDHLAFLPRNHLRRYTNRCVSSPSNNFEQNSAVESTEEDTSTSDFQSEDKSLNEDNIHSEEFEDYLTLIMTQIQLL